MATKTADKVVITDKSVNGTERADLTDKATSIANTLDKMPSNGEKVAGYLAAHTVSGDYTPEKNPVTNFVRQVAFVWGLPKGWKLTSKASTYDGAEVVVDSGNFKASIPLPSGVKEFLKSFNNGYHGELYLYV